MKKALLILLSATMVLMLFTACNGNGSSTPSGVSTDSTGSVDTSFGDGGEPSGPKTLEDMTAEDWENLKNEERSLKIELLPNTFTEELWDILLEGFQADHPGWDIETELTAETAESVQAKIINGTPPAFFQHGLNFTVAQATEAGVLQPIYPLLDAPAYDEPGVTVRETLMPGMDSIDAFDGIAYTIPFRLSGNGFWYNVQMFEDNNWEEPQTYAEFLELCEEIKAAGITPLIFTGTYSPYAYNMFVYPRLCALGDGFDSSADMANLVDGAWSGDNVRQAVQDLKDMMDAGIFTSDVLGTDYLLVQQMFFEGNAAMVMSGTWLESEMLDVIPEGFRFNFMAAPVRESADDVTHIAGWAGGFSFCKDSGMEVEAMEFTRYILSSAFMKHYAEKMGEPLIPQTYAELDPSMFTPAGLSIHETFNAPNTLMIDTIVMSWYPELFTDFTSGVIGVLAGNETIDNLLTQTEQQVQEIKEDDLIPKYVYG